MRRAAGAVDRYRSLGDHPFKSKLIHLPKKRLALLLNVLHAAHAIHAAHQLGEDRLALD
jgi:hypothetical protein